MAQLMSCLTFLAILSVGLCSKCQNLEVTSKSFTTEDATIVASIAYISEFSVKCSSGSVSNLYSIVNGNVVPVSVVGANSYQVSWTEDIKSSKSGSQDIRIFDEEGYTALRKAIRGEEDLSSVSDLFTVRLDYTSAYNGPWLKSEFVAVALSFAVAYFAIASRSKVVS